MLESVGATSGMNANNGPVAVERFLRSIAYWAYWGGYLGQTYLVESHDAILYFILRTGFLLFTLGAVFFLRRLPRLDE